jgi:CheY-like chemotaxis protein
MKAINTVIVAEDDNDFNRLIQEALQKEGFHTIGASNGKDAINRIIEDEESLLLLDCNLPDMTGRQVIETLSERKYNIPFILIIEEGNEKAALEMMKAGARDYVIKGSTLTDMVPVMVKDVLKDLERENEMIKAEEVYQQKFYLNQIILDRLPCVTLLVESHTREIIVSNAAAAKFGAVPGNKCFSAWVQREDPCPWCKAPLLWESGEEQHFEFEAAGSVWDAYLVHVDRDLYLHYAFDISSHRQH